MTTDTWYVYGPDGMQIYTSEAKARKAAEECLDEYAGEMISSGEWEWEVETLEWGRLVPFQKIVGTPVPFDRLPKEEREPGVEYVDYLLRDVEVED